MWSSISWRVRRSRRRPPGASRRCGAAGRARSRCGSRPEHADGALLRDAVALAGLQGRGLAGAVGAEDRGDRPARDLEREPVDGHLVAVAPSPARRSSTAGAAVDTPLSLGSGRRPSSASTRSWSPGSYTPNRRFHTLLPKLSTGPLSGRPRWPSVSWPTRAVIRRLGELASWSPATSPGGITCRSTSPGEAHDAASPS